VVPTHPVSAPLASALVHTVRRGETLVTIADRFGVSLSQLRRWNRITGIKVRAGQRLRVSDPESAPRSVDQGHRHGRSRTRRNHREAEPAKSDAAKSRARSREGATGAKKSSVTGSRKSHARRHAAHSKSSASKQK
jgi:membrane-bound lytic murein transglycosylase D